MMLFNSIIFFIPFFIMKINSDSEAYLRALSLAETAPTKELKEECLYFASIIEESLSINEALFCKACFESAKKELNY